MSMTSQYSPDLDVRSSTTDIMNQSINIDYRQNQSVESERPKVPSLLMKAEPPRN
jgi:hypothetical protein